MATPSPVTFPKAVDPDGLDDAPVESNMSEQQLRELYDNEEIERFLSLFSAHVTEVQMPEGPSNEQRLHPNSQVSEPPANSTDGDGHEAVHAKTSSPAVYVQGPDSSDGSAAPPFTSDRSLSEDIAFQYVIPLLPHARPPPPPFTLGRLRLTTQRLYLAVQPVYIPFLTRMAKLATWEEKKTSFIYCVIFWLMWYYNLVLPCLFLRILYSLARRKVFPYPTLKELQNHRSQITHANEFGDEISTRLSASSFGVKEMWRLLKVYNKTTKAKAEHSAKEKIKEKGLMSSGGEDVNPDAISESEGATVLDDSKDSQDAKDLKRLGLHILSELGDLHERIKNIFIWRRPTSSRMYGAVIFFLFLITLLLPTKYIAKLIYFIGGVLFWHVTPVVAALPPADRARLPPPFGDVPTDADFAMEMIAKRVAAGLDVKPTRHKKPDKRRSRAGTADDTDPSVPREGYGEKRRDPDDKGKAVDWKKWGERAAISKNWADDGKRLVSGRPNNATWSPRSSPLVPQSAMAIAQPAEPTENHTYPAKHTSAPGLITVTPTTLLFTPLMSTNPKFVILLSDIRGVKKTGLLKGLYIRSVETPPSGERVEREESFMWIGGRDELFARLVGTDGRRWLKV